MIGPFKKTTPIRDLVMAKVNAKIDEAEAQYTETCKKLDNDARIKAEAIWERLAYDKNQEASALADSILP